MISRRRWLVAVGASFVATSSGCHKQPPIVPYCGVRPWWIRQQAADGGWHSAHYATLRSGSALTPLYLVVCNKSLPVDSRSNAIAFVRRSVNADGVVGCDDPELPEYPNYATSLALQCLAAAKVDADRPLVERMSAYLLGQQYCEANGFGPDHECYGGWGFGGVRPVGDSPGHMDIGHTRHVLQALRAAGHDDPATYARAESFLARMQKRSTPACDGGFYFSPIVHAANKGGETTIDGVRYFRSYATATCDGVLALLACGASRDDERVQDAADWLRRHPRLDYPEGVLEGTDTNWSASIRFYHFAVRAECYAALDWPGDWRRELREIILKLQQPDGSYVNREGFLMKEDDPLLCTALAVFALANCGI